MIEMGSMICIIWGMTQHGSLQLKHEWISGAACGRTPLKFVHHLVQFVGVLVVIVITTDIVIIFAEAPEIRLNLACRN